VDGLLSEEEFQSLLAQRLSSEDGDLFSLLRFDLPTVPDLGSVLVDAVRAESGDLVAPLGDGFGVLLQDARAQQAEAFLRRVQTELRQHGHSVTLEAEILSSPDESDRIRQLIGT
jgi:hypothetical protein